MKHEKLQVNLINKKKKVLVDYGQNLLCVLKDEKIFVSSFCEGSGRCGKCLAKVDGEFVLSCQYKITKDITVEVKEEESILSFDSLEIDEKYDNGNINLAVDIGTTTISLAFLEEGKKLPFKIETYNNPQIKYGLDIMSRIQYSTRDSGVILHDVLISSLNEMIEATLRKYKKNITKAAFAGNTAMIHFLLNLDARPLGTYPYKAALLSFYSCDGKDIGLTKVGKVDILPSINSFIGSDILSGLSILSLPSEGKFNFFIDLGTNAEIVIYSKDVYLAVSSAAGPCFEGGHISCGMSATRGAIYSYSMKGDKVECKVITSNEKSKSSEKYLEDIMPIGLCGSGLIDAIASIYDNGLIDKSGTINNSKSIAILNNLRLNQQDIREFQLAKSAIRAAIDILLKEIGCDAKDIETVYLSGGISSKISVESAIKSSLLPIDFYNKTRAIPNSSLLGLINYLSSGEYLKKGIYFIDLALHPMFKESYIKYINFAV